MIALNVKAYVAALAARLQPQFAIGDDIATDADMSDLPEVLDLVRSNID